MKLTALEIAAFGSWRKLRWDQLDAGLNVFYGPNEAGKTTVLQFLRTMFFGATTPRLRRYLSAADKLVSGGSIELDSNRGRVRLVRTYAPDRRPGELFEPPGGESAAHPHETGWAVTAAPEQAAAAIAGEVDLYGPEGGRLSDSLWRSLLAGVDDHVFENVFAVGLREIQELGSLTDTAAADLLYGLSTGVDRVSVVEVARELRRSRERLWNPADASGRLAQLEAEQQRIAAELEALQGAGGAQGSLVRERENLSQEIVRWEEQSRLQRERGDWLEAVLALVPKWQQCAELAGQLARLPSPREVSKQQITRLDRIQKRLTDLSQRATSLRHERDQLSAEAATLAIDTQLERQSARIEALTQQRDLIEMLEGQVASLEAEVQDLVEKSRVESRGTGEPRPTPSRHRDTRHDVARRASEGGSSSRRGAWTRGVLLELRKAGRLYSRQRKAYGVARRAALERKRQRKERQAEERDSDEPRRMRRPANLTKALADAGHQVNLLRRRVQLEQRVDSLGRQRRDLDEQLHQSWEDELLSERALWTTGGLVAAGVAALMAGWLLPETVIGSGGGLLMMLGLGLTGAGGVAKYSLERRAAQDAEVAQRQLKLVEKQFREAQQERDDLDRKLMGGDTPETSGPLVSRLKHAEERLAQLEQFLPKEGAAAATDAAPRKPRRTFKQQQQLYRRALQRWQRALTRAGLPPKSTPNEVRDLLRDDRETRLARERLIVRREELSDRRRALDEFASRIRSLLPGEHQPAAEEPLSEALGRLHHILREQQGLLDRRRRLKRRRHKIERELAHLARQDELWRNRRMQLLRRAKAKDEAELRARLDRLAQRQRVEVEHRQRQHEFDLALGQLHEPDEAGRLLAEAGASEIEHQWTEAQTRHQQAEQELKRLYERRGEMAQRWKALAEDPAVPAKQLELALVDARLAAAQEEWQVLAVASQTLDQVRRRYERDRQPEALRIASRYLERFTEGRYLRIWTPLDEATLLVEAADGQVRRVEDLSRGTREQLFISLRLALVEAYDRRGVSLPVILDDLLVNFDSARARAAVAVLREFAEAGHQVLLFTCHEHLAQIFQEAGLGVRQLTGERCPPFGAVPPPAPEPAPVVLPEPALSRPIKLERRRKRRPETEPTEAYLPVQVLPIELEELNPPTTVVHYQADLGDDFVEPPEPQRRVPVAEPVFEQPSPISLGELPQPRPRPLAEPPRERWRWVWRMRNDHDAQDFAGEFSERRIIYDRGEQRATR